MPFSECYCDDCWERARDEYEFIEATWALEQAASAGEINEIEARVRQFGADQLADPRFAEKVGRIIAMHRRRVAT